MNKIKLLPGETMAEYRARVRLQMEAGAVLKVIRCNPGIGSEHAISVLTGFDPERVAVVVRALQRNEAGQPRHIRVDYGPCRARSGPWAGKMVTGWWPMDVAAYQMVMEYADEHSAAVERGVRESRRSRLLYAKGLNTIQAATVVAEVERRMKVKTDELGPADAAKFDRMAAKLALEVIDMNGSA